MFEPWFLYIMGAVVFYAVGVLMMRRVLPIVGSLFATTTLISGLAVVFLIYWLFTGASLPPLESIPLLLLVIVFAALGNVADQESVKRAPNPGFPGAIKASQGLFIISLSLVVIPEVTFSIDAFMYSLFAIVGVIGIIYTGSARIADESPVKKSRTWQLFAGIATFSFVIIVVAFREIIERDYMDPVTFLTFMWLGTALVLVLYSVLQNRIKIERPPRWFYGWMLVTILVYSFANIGEFVSNAISPNPGYTSAIKGSQIMLISLIAPLLFADATLNKKQFFFILLVVLGVGGLALV